MSYRSHRSFAIWRCEYERCLSFYFLDSGTRDRMGDPDVAISGQLSERLLAQLLKCLGAMTLKSARCNLKEIIKVKTATRLEMFNTYD